jgi:acyl-CoA thioesterase-1
MSRIMVILLAWLAALAAPLARASAAAGAPTSRPAPVILVFGDSLSAGYGVPPGHGWVDLLAQKIAREGYDFSVVNASVSGETTAGGLARLPRALALHAPRILILELGANDGLRGLPVAQAKANLEQMIGLAQARGTRVLLIGIRMPPNYGERYTSAFHAMYGQLAQRHGLALVPLLLASVALKPGLIQADGLHPNERAQPLLLATVWPTLQPLLAPAAHLAAHHGAHLGAPPRTPAAAGPR